MCRNEDGIYSRVVDQPQYVVDVSRANIEIKQEAGFDVVEIK